LNRQLSSWNEWWQKRLFTSAVAAAQRSANETRRRDRAEAKVIVEAFRGNCD
jgi:predicted alpha-1,6-mannanase (GH76 family)